MEMWFDDRELTREMGFKSKKLVTCIALVVERRARGIVKVITGTLKRSITHVVTKVFDGWGATVGSNVEYAPHVELGTKNMAARPYLRPALESFNEQDFNNCVNNVKET